MIEARVQKSEEHKEQFLATSDRNFNGMRTSMGQIIHEQGDIRKIVEELARRMDTMQHGTHPRNAASDSGAAQGQTLTDAGVTMQLEIEDLKAKVARRIEQSTDHSTQIGLLNPLKETVELAVNQVIKWRHGLPDLTDDEDDSTIVTAVEVQEQLQAFRVQIRDRINEIRLETQSLEVKLASWNRLAVNLGSW